MISQQTSLTSTTSNMDTFHKLSDNWTIWAHLPHNTDWSIKSYIPIYTFTNIEETIAVTETLPAILVENCMLFIMKEGIKPTWEDPKNRNGGCFSYKVSNKTRPRSLLSNGINTLFLLTIPLSKIPRLVPQSISLIIISCATSTSLRVR